MPYILGTNDRRLLYHFCPQPQALNSVSASYHVACVYTAQRGTERDDHDLTTGPQEVDTSLELS